MQILAYVFAGNQYALYSYLDYIAKQSIPVTSQDEALLSWAALKGLTLVPAAPATGQVTFSGVVGSVIPDETVLVRSDGITYAIPTGAGGIIGGGSTFTTIATATSAGLISNMAAGAAILSLQTPISGVLNSVVVSTDFVGGADVETQDSLRTRMIQAFSNPAQGGDLADYVSYSLAFPGVTRAWSAGPSIMGAGTVSVFWMQDDASHTNGIPHGLAGGSQFENRITPGTLDALALADFIYPQRSATAIVWAIPPIPDAINITLQEVPVDTTIRANITTALASFLIRKASPGGVLLSDLTPGGIIRVSQLEAAISAVPGLDFYELTLLNGSAPVDFTSATAHIAVPGTITYV